MRIIYKACNNAVALFPLVKDRCPFLLFAHMFEFGSDHNCPNFLRSVCPNLRKDRWLMALTSEQHPEWFSFADPSMKDDELLVRRLLDRGGSPLIFTNASDRLRTQKYLLLKVLRGEGRTRCSEQLLELFKNLPREWFKDRDIVKLAVLAVGTALKYAPEFQDDFEIVLSAVEIDGMALEFASDRLRKDKEVVQSAVKSESLALQWAGAKWKKDYETILLAVSKSGDAIQFLSKQWRNNIDIVRVAVRSSASSYRHAGPTPRNDFDIALTAVKGDSYMLRYVPRRLQNNKEIVLSAVKECVEDFQFAGEKTTCDFEIANIVVKKGSWDLIERVSHRLWEDKNIALQWLKINPYFIEYIENGPLFDDEEVILAALSHDSFHFDEFVNDYLDRNGWHPDLMSERLRSDRTFLERLPSHIDAFWLNSDFGDDKNFVSKRFDHIYRVQCGYIDLEKSIPRLSERLQEDPGFCASLRRKFGTREYWMEILESGEVFFDIIRGDLPLELLSVAE